MSEMSRHPFSILLFVCLPTYPARGLPLLLLLLLLLIVITISTCNSNSSNSSNSNSSNSKTREARDNVQLPALSLSLIHYH